MNFHPDRFRILRKWTTRLDYTGHWEIVVDKYFKCKLPAKWNVTSQFGKIADCEMGAVYLCICNSRESAKGAEVKGVFQHRIYFRQLD